VTINNASGGSAVNIQDGGNSITVDGMVAVSGTVTVDSELTTADLDTGAGTDTRAVVGVVLAASGGGALAPGDATKGLKVQVTDGSGAQITSFGGGVEYAEDTAHSSGDTGKLVLAVRRDANTTLVDATGDYAPLQVDAAGSLKVAITAGAGSGGTSIADDAAFTVASTSITPVGGTYRGTLDAVDDGDAGAFAMTARRALHAYLVDSNGDPLSVGGGTQYTEDAAAAGDPVGNAVMLVRKDTPGTTVSTDGDNIAQRGTNYGAAYVTLLDTSGSAVSVGGGTQYDEDAASAGAEKLTLAGAVRRDTAASSSGTDGDYSTLNTDATGRLWAHVGTIDGGTITTVSTVSTITNVVHVDDNAGSLTVDNGGTFAVQATIAAGAAAIAKAEDVASADADVGVPAMMVRKATPANTSGTDGDYEFLQGSAGRLWTSSTIDAALPAGTNAIGKLAANAGVTIGAVEIAATQTLATVTSLTQMNGAAIAMGTGARSAGTQRVTIATDDVVPASQSGTWNVGTLTTLTGGGVAHDGADSGNPVKVGGRARSSEIAAVANDDRSDLVTDLVGKLITMPYANPENFVSGAITSAMTGTTSTSLIAAPAAGLRNYITQVTVSNAHATVGTDVILQDGSGGTTLYTIPAAAVYGGATLTFPTPLRQPTTATALYCANVTTGASTKVSASGWKGS
jgi:hypothetical protein